MAMNCTFMDTEQIQREFDSLTESMKSVEELKNTSLKTLFPDDFICRFTSCESIKELFAKSGHTIQSQADIDSARENGFDAFIRETTSFDDWDAMLEAALCELISRNNI